MCTNYGDSQGFFGASRRRIVELEGPKGTFSTGKSSCMCTVATASLHFGRC